jgi:competence protein ComEC
VSPIKALAPARRPPIAIFALAFLAGILFIQGFAQLPSVLWLLLLLPVCGYFLWRMRGSGAVVVLVLAFTLGAAWAGVRAAWILRDTLPATLQGRDLILTGRVDSIPRTLPYGRRFDFLVESARAGAVPASIPRHIRLRAGLRLPVRVGQRWRFTARLKRPHGYQNPGGFDYEGYLFENRIRALGYVRSGSLLAPPSTRYAIARIRSYLATRIATLAGSSNNAGVFTALVTGERGAIRHRQWRLLRATGTSHLVAISGLHIGLVSGLVFLLASWGWRRTLLPLTLWPASQVAAIAAWLAAAAYSLLAGWSLPTQRALIMVSIVLAGVVLGRRYRPGVVLSGALLGVLAWDPLSVLAAGFWLSFAAVGAIYLLIYGHGVRRRFSLVRIQGAITLVLAPVGLVWFQQLSLSAPLANLLAVPLFTAVVVPATLVSVLTDLIGLPGPATHMLTAASWCLDWLWDGLAVLARLPMWTRGGLGLVSMTSAVLGVVLLLIPRGLPGRWLGGLCLLPLLFPAIHKIPFGQMDFTLLDVGQGLAAVVRTRDHTLVFDAGPRFGPRFDTGEAVVVPYLRSLGVNHVDRLVISHGDNDHMGGAESIRRLLPVRQILTGVPGRLHGSVACHVGEAWTWDGVGFRLLSPTLADPMKHNNHSCVLRVRSPYGSLLLPADIEARREKELVARVGLGLHAEILVAPHHGSRTSSTPGFLDAVRPQWALFPVGYLNRYHHPHPVVVARMRARGIHMLGSADSGAISVRFGPDGLKPARYRVDSAHYWFDRPAFAQSGRSATLAPDPKMH